MYAVFFFLKLIFFCLGGVCLAGQFVTSAGCAPVPAGNHAASSNVDYVKMNSECVHMPPFSLIFLTS